MTHAVTVSHTFETAHRLPMLGGKCSNIHGHSWRVEWTFAGELDSHGILLDFAELKRALRAWVDAYLDHGAMLGSNDVLVGPLEQLGSKVYVFGRDPHTPDLPWPTVECVTSLLGRVANDQTGHPPVRVVVTETATNAAEVTW